MKFGKLQDISTVDFSFPTDAPQNKALLLQLPKNEKKPTFYVGCTGWSMNEWVGKTYPAGTKSKDFLKQYVKQFNTIELNTTHYRIPNRDTIQKWKMTAPSDFRYCPKIPQTISHSRDLGKMKDDLLRFCDAIAGLEAKLGCAFIQLPPYFGYDRLPILEHFLRRFPSHIDLAVEVRHESWFDNPQHLDALAALCTSEKKTLLMTDVAGRRDVLHQRLTNTAAMVRFVGNGLHPTDYERIDDWVERLNIWLQEGLQEVYFFPHQPDNVLAPDMAAYVVDKVKAVCDVIVRGPQLGEKPSGEQMALF